MARQPILRLKYFPHKDLNRYREEDFRLVNYRNLPRNTRHIVPFTSIFSELKQLLIKKYQSHLFCNVLFYFYHNLCRNTSRILLFYVYFSPGNQPWLAGQSAGRRWTRRMRLVRHDVPLTRGRVGR